MRTGLRQFCATAVVAALGLTACGVLAPGAHAADKVDDEAMVLTTTAFPVMRPGETAWVSTFWKAGTEDARYIRVTATSSGAKIEYPENTSSYASLYGSDILLADGTDFASLKVTVHDGVKDDIRLRVRVVYEIPNGKGASRRVDDSFVIPVPIEVYSGDPITPLTESFGSIARGTDAWTQLSLRGEKPDITDVSATAVADEGITITYPNDASFSRLNESSDLAVGETDYVGLHITVGDAKPGTYDVTVTLRYSRKLSQVVVVPVTVT